MMSEMYAATIGSDEVAALPLCTYEGNIVVVDSPEQVDDALKMFCDCAFVGFDTETRPSFRKGVTHPVSLLQLASGDIAVLFRLNKTGLTSSLKKFLSDKNVTKVGVGIRDDQKALVRLSPFKPASFLDLQDIAPGYGIEEKSFAKLMAIVFGVHVSKRQRVSNWEADTLSESQLRYAATDAWGAWKMYEKFTG